MARICPECSDTDIEWFCRPHTNSGVVDGRLRMHDIRVEFYLGCNYCSETIESISSDEVAKRLARLDAINN